jgi:hypothetical protein
MQVWEVEYTDQFGSWYEVLNEQDQDAVVARVELLEQLEPALGPTRCRQRAPVEALKHEGTAGGTSATGAVRLSTVDGPRSC